MKENRKNQFWILLSHSCESHTIRSHHLESYAKWPQDW